MSNIKYTKEILQNAVNKSNSFADVCRNLKITPRTGSQTHISKRIHKYEIDTSHFTGKLWHKSAKMTLVSKPVQYYLVNGSTIKSRCLLKKLIRCGMKDYKCEICNLTIWNNESICLELHHIDKNHFNNEFSNLQILCPNCHSICHRNKIKIKIKKEPVNTFCPDCGKKISSGAIHCSDCYRKYSHFRTNKYPQPTKIQWPSKKSLVNKLKTMSYLALSKELGVSDNAIRKHLKNH